MNGPLERIDELLVQRATEGLAPHEAAELGRLLERHRDVDAESIGLAAAAVELSRLRTLEPMPPRLRARIVAGAPSASPAARAAGLGAPRRRASRAVTQPVWAWLATAAAIVLALTGWWPASSVPLEEQRAALVAAGGQQARWAATEDPAATAASGDIVWDSSTQRGFMRFAALAVNEPSRFQYQLWIFDATRDERYPVDGGVFDIPAGASEVIVPIRAKLRVGDAVMFAVTAEQPGGVVVSARERIVLVATPGSA